MRRTTAIETAVPVFSLFLSCACSAFLIVCTEGCRQSRGVFVTVETNCDSILESVELVFGDHSEYCGSIGKGGGYTVVGVEYPVLVNQASIRFNLKGKGISLDVPLKQIAPVDLNGSYEVVFTVFCAATPNVEVSFWRFVMVDGKLTREEIA